MSRESKSVRRTDRELDILGSGDAPPASSMKPGPERTLAEVREAVDQRTPWGAR
jgi:hypothetical protein